MLDTLSDKSANAVCGVAHAVLPSSAEMSICEIGPARYYTGLASLAAAVLIVVVVISKIVADRGG